MESYLKFETFSVQLKDNDDEVVPRFATSASKKPIQELAEAYSGERAGDPLDFEELHQTSSTADDKSLTSSEKSNRAPTTPTMDVSDDFLSNFN